MPETNPLLTPKAFEASLSPPRVPPFGSIHRELYTNSSHKKCLDGPTPAITPHHYHVNRKGDNNGQGEDHQDDILHHYYLRLLLLAASRRNLPHPHMAKTSADATTRYIASNLWSVPSMNQCRDSGLFRTVVDGLVTTMAAPMMAISSPHTVRQFLRLTQQRETLRYGTHKRQYMDVWEPASTIIIKRWIVFFHGGAWGSGHSWMYRLVADSFLEHGYGVAICSYRVYPDGKIQEQLEDLDAVIRLLIVQRIGRDMKITLMGHSSGAHVSLLWLVRNRLFDETTIDLFRPVDSFVGLSGPYDINHHFDYEAGRGVEEISPMKPVNGDTKHAFQHNSPAHWLSHALTQRSPSCWKTHIHLPKIVLMHGMEDDTVPFTATAEAARMLLACGLPIDQVYLGKTGHQDVPIHLMVGGRALEAVIEWIGALEDDNNNTTKYKMEHSRFHANRFSKL